MSSPSRWLLPLLLVLSGCPRTQQATQQAAPPPDATAAPAVVSTAALSVLAPEQRAAYEGADAIVIATLIDPKITAILEIDPPIYVHQMKLSVEKQLLGMPLPADTLHWSSRDQGKPLPTGMRFAVAVRRVQENLVEKRETLSIVGIDPVTADLEHALSTAFAPAPDGLRIVAAQIAPTKVLKWQNEYGDGEFELTITNDTDVPRVVPGLASSSGHALFEDALEIRDEHGRVLHLPRSGASGTPFVLAPHASVTTRVDVKPFGLEHPAGGSREHYSFAVGTLRISSFFYYSHNLHGPSMGKP